MRCHTVLKAILRALRAYALSVGGSSCLYSGVDDDVEDSHPLMLQSQEEDFCEPRGLSGRVALGYVSGGGCGYRWLYFCYYE